MNIRPLGDRVLVKTVEEGEQERGGYSTGKSNSLSKVK